MPRGAMTEAELLDRITIEPGKCGGRPCIRDVPPLEREDISASLVDAARLLDHPVLVTRS